MPEPSVRIQTPLGNLEFLIESADTPSLGACIHAASFQPEIPPGMSVLACYGVVLQIGSPNTVSDLKFKAILKPSSEINVGAATGEGLEAQDWDNQRSVMLVGTEDLEYLKARLHHSIVLPDNPFTYSAKSLSIHIAEIPAGVSVSLHFVVAWNDLPETVESSCWFAVDQSHTSILSAVGANPAFKRGALKRAP
jgi:hypothetical protein